MKFKDVRVGTVIEQLNEENDKVVGLGMVAKKCEECYKRHVKNTYCIKAIKSISNNYSIFCGGGCVSNPKYNEQMWMVSDDYLNEDTYNIRIAENQNPYIGD